MSDVVIRRALPVERSPLEALQWRASLANPGDRDSLLANPDAISIPVEQIAAGHVFVAEHDGVMVGFAAILARPDGNTELDALFVEPSLWKRGVGRLLVEHCADVARGRSSRILHVVGNPHAEGFYAACGFRTTGSVETRFGAGLAMERELGRRDFAAEITSTPPGGLDGGDVDLLHRHHRREGTLGFTATSRKRLG